MTCSDDNCAQCPENPSVCSQCNADFTPASGACHQLCPGFARSCEINEICADGKCQQCRNGMTNIGKKCLCDTALECSAGQYCSGGSQCLSCTTTMPNCAECSDAETCRIVDKLCTDPNCLLCEKDVSTCSQCTFGFKMKLNSCRQNCGEALCGEKEICSAGQCVACKPNEINEFGACMCGLHQICKANQYCSEKLDCIVCTDNCTACDQKTCQKCTDGYTLENNNCSKNKNSQAGIIAGSVVAGVVVIGAICGLLYYFLYYRKRSALPIQLERRPTDLVHNLQQSI